MPLQLCLGSGLTISKCQDPQDLKTRPQDKTTRMMYQPTDQACAQCSTNQQVYVLSSSANPVPICYTCRALMLSGADFLELVDEDSKYFLQRLDDMFDDHIHRLSIIGRQVVDLSISSDEESGMSDTEVEEESGMSDTEVEEDDDVAMSDGAERSDYFYRYENGEYHSDLDSDVEPSDINSDAGLYYEMAGVIHNGEEAYVTESEPSESD